MRKVNEEALIRSGFSNSDLRKIRNNLESYGGTLDEAIQDLANRFRIVIWIALCCFAVFLMLLLFASKQTAGGGGVSLLIGVIIVMFIQPPVLSYKSWRYWRANKS